MKRFVISFLVSCLLLSAVPASCFYNPNTGRWLSRDPSGESGGANLHGFVRNDPQTESDRLGLDENPKPCSTCGGACDQKKKKCSIARKVAYDPPSGSTMNYTREGTHKTAVFTFSVEFQHDPSQSICAGCCEIRSYIKWSKDGYPLQNTAWTPPQKYAPDKWYEDRTPDDKRYGYRSGPHSVGPDNWTVERFEDANGQKNWLCGTKCRGQDTPTVPSGQKGRWSFQLEVVDICSGGKVLDTTAGPVIDWEKEEKPK